MRYLILLSVLFATPTLAGPYVLYGLETSNSPHRGTELQNRMEVGYSANRYWDFYLYHESDPRNGLEGTGYVGETENGAGVRLRYEFD